MKEFCAADALFHYLDFLERFDIHTNSSKFQMGGVISERGQPVAYWSRKLSPAQQKYPTIKQDILAIFECLKEFRHMLLGHKLQVHIDYKNLTYGDTKYANDCVLCQSLVLEEYSPELV